MDIYFRGYMSPLTLILRGIWSDFRGHLNKNIPEISKLTCRLLKNFRGHLKLRGSKSRIFEGHGKP